jgi:hypothetical protein
MSELETTVVLGGCRTGFGRELDLVGWCTYQERGVFIGCLPRRSK